MKRCNRYYLLLWIFLILSPVISAQIGGGYVKPFSVVKGDTLNIYISTSKPSFDIIVYRCGLKDSTVLTIRNVTAGRYAVSEIAYATGVNWPVTYRLKIPEDWPGGAYALDFPDSDGTGSKGAVFAVKEKIPGSYSKVLMVFSDFNWIAYNYWGGKNFYNENSTNNQRSYRLSLNRPYIMSRGLGEFNAWNKKLIKWFENNNIKYEIASEMDIHKDAKFLDNYDVLYVSGHNEYYTRQLRLNIEHFINRGGRHFSLSGNTCWWQVRLEDDDNTMVCYKSNEDPYIGKIDSLATVNWYAPPLYYPENRFLGASYQYAGYVNDLHHSEFSYADGYGDYGVFNSQHWIYKNTGLKDGDEFGRLPDDSTTAIVGYEVDGTLFTYKNGLPQPLGTDQTPLNFRILGISPAILSGVIVGQHATMGMMTNSKGGAMFNSSSINWVNGLEKDTLVSHIQMNLHKKFTEGRLPPEIVSWSPFTLKNAVVNGEAVKLNTRDISLKSKDSVKLSFIAQDPYKEKLGYIWYVDTIKRSTDSVFSFIATAGGTFKVRGYVYNSRDTASIAWAMKVDGPTIAGNENQAMPKTYFLEQNYPNPFNPMTTIKYGLAHDGLAKIEIFNIVGQKAAIILNEVQKAGNYEINFDAASLPSGIYIYKITAAGFTQAKKMILLK